MAVNSIARPTVDASFLEIMHITDIMRGDTPTFSFEFFPPNTPDAEETLYQTIRELEAYMPHFVSVTYGAGGSTRDLTHELVERIKSTTALPLGQDDASSPPRDVRPAPETA